MLSLARRKPDLATILRIDGDGGSRIPRVKQLRQPSDGEPLLGRIVIFASSRALEERHVVAAEVSARPLTSANRTPQANRWSSGSSPHQEPSPASAWQAAARFPAPRATVPSPGRAACLLPVSPRHSFAHGCASVRVYPSMPHLNSGIEHGASGVKANLMTVNNLLCLFDVFATRVPHVHEDPNSHRAIGPPRQREVVRLAERALSAQPPNPSPQSAPNTPGSPLFAGPHNRPQ